MKSSFELESDLVNLESETEMAILVVSLFSNEVLMTRGFITNKKMCIWGPCVLVLQQSASKPDFPPL